MAKEEIHQEMIKDWDPDLVVKFAHHGSRFDEARSWCQKNCQDDWYFGLPNPFYFKFKNADDATLFKLTWG